MAYLARQERAGDANPRDAPMGVMDFDRQSVPARLSRTVLCEAAAFVTNGEVACAPDCLEGQYGQGGEAPPMAGELLTDILADLASHRTILSEVAQAGGVDARNDDDARRDEVCFRTRQVGADLSDIVW
jgi:hypothetical protein